MEMVKTKLIIALMLLVPVLSMAQEYSWRADSMDGSRTGCTATTEDNVDKALGTFDGSKYISPKGKVHPESSATAKVARLMISAQPEMARVKKVIAFSEEAMRSSSRECKLSNWFVGIVMRKVQELSGKKVDVGICNFGGIRQDMPEGDVILDDILSMFPFRNNIVYLELKGSDLRNIFETMAATRFQAVGGADILAEDGKLAHVRIDGEPLEDDKLYSVATISFLLDGGDSLSLGANAVNLKEFDVQIVDAVLSVINSDGGRIVAPDVKYVTVR